MSISTIAVFVNEPRYFLADSFAPSSVLQSNSSRVRIVVDIRDYRISSPCYNRSKVCACVANDLPVKHWRLSRNAVYNLSAIVGSKPSLISTFRLRTYPARRANCKMTLVFHFSKYQDHRERFPRRMRYRDHSSSTSAPLSHPCFYNRVLFHVLTYALPRSSPETRIQSWVSMLVRWL